VLACATGLLGAATRQSLSLEPGARAYEFGELPGHRTDVAQCYDDGSVRRALAQGVWGLGKSLTTCAVSLGIVVVYYGILVVWFWLIPLRRCPYLTQTLFLALSANQGPPKFFPRLVITLAVPDVAQKPTKSSVFIHRY
jgi:hypothetical protein